MINTIATRNGKNLSNMGSKSSKEVPELMGDKRYLEQRDKRNIDFGPKWRKKYEFDGRLDVEKLELLIKQIHKECGKDVRKQNKQGLNTAIVWLSEARKRAEGEKKKQDVSSKQEKERIGLAALGKVRKDLTKLRR